MRSGERRPTIGALMVYALSFSAVAALTLNPVIPVLSPVVAADHASIAERRVRVSWRSELASRSSSICRVTSRMCWSPTPNRQRGHPFRAAGLHHRRGRRSDQCRVLRRVRPQIAAYDIAVKRDLNGVRAALRQAMPNSNVQIEGVGDGVMLTGTVATPIEAQQAGDLAARLAGGPKGRQFDCRARQGPGDAEGHGRRGGTLDHQADGHRSLGQPNVGNSVVTFNNNTPFTANNAPLVPGNALTGSFGTNPSVQATMRAMESAGVVRTLAEPNLTAISGESATFVEGGEFPIPPA